MRVYVGILNSYALVVGSIPAGNIDFLQQWS